ncbi:MAG: Biotin carboxyl carrier protein of acetyl-CoA carboxylase [Verrucomicrobia bacterium ADurb.Bin345]|nr:MAG: Biotin carboxyl carrier protein of acetyl-CoA carboxylase [Verrucomicrobia bacterium ADurb.Bin345]
MDIKNIKKLIDLMKANDLSEFEIEEEGFRLAIKRKNGAEQVILGSPAAQSVLMAPAAAAVAAPAAPATAAPAEAAAGSKLLEIKSPIVGTFYRSPAPDADPFVSVGKSVEDETVVCVIEAMKVMNEIKAEVKGVIRKVLVENATPVQFGQVLFLVEPA